MATMRLSIAIAVLHLLWCGTPASATPLRSLVKPAERINPNQNHLSQSASRWLSKDLGSKLDPPTIMAHSHNDEMQRIPFKHALSLGFLSIEADTWLIDSKNPNLDDDYRDDHYDDDGHFLQSEPLGSSDPTFTIIPEEQGDQEPEPTLYVGHTRRNAFHPDRTLKVMYLDRIWDILEKANPGRNESTARKKDMGRGDARGRGGDGLGVEHDEGADREEMGWDWNGVYEDDPEKSLIFQIDTKGNGELLWPHLLDALEPFFTAGYLTTFYPNSSTDLISGTLIRGPLTMIGTGGTPAHLVYAQSPRYVYYDAPLLKLVEGLTLPTGEHIEWHPSFAPTASALFPTSWYYPSPRSHSDQLQAISDLAHAKGIQVRWWGLVYPPRARRWRVMLWTLLMQAGSDWLNVDELDEAGLFLRSGRGSWNDV